jgi:hypothetical protein
MSAPPPYVQPHPVVVIDLDIPFGRLVAIFIKWTLAAIPAMIIVWLILAVITAFLGAIFGMGWLMHMAR